MCGRRFHPGVLDALVARGQIVKGRLEAEGIPVDLRGEHEGPYPVGPAELYAPTSLETQARRILEQIDSGSYEAPAEDDAGPAPTGEHTE